MSFRMSEEMQCARCGAPLVLPSDYGAWLVRCQYCGFEHELPDRAGRQAYADRRRQEQEAAARAQAEAVARDAWNKKSSRNRSIQRFLLVAVPIGLVIGAVWFIEHFVTFTTDTASAQISQQLSKISELSTPPPAMLALGTKAKASGCPTAVDQPTFANNEYSGTYTLVKSECIRFLAVATPAAPLALLITDPAGVVTTRSAPTGTLDTSYCPKTEGSYQSKIRGAAQFWMQAVACPRKFGEDPVTTGKEKVAARLKELMTHGCFDIALANTVFFDDRKFTTSLNPGTCFDVIAATGVSDNDLTVTMSTPFGESVAPMPAPATSFEVAYCAASAGPHVVDVGPAVNGPFAAAIAVCNRSALPKLLPKAGK
jgi:hypothetical protein